MHTRLSSSLVLLLALTGAARQLPAQEPSVISGRILAAGTGAPVADAIVRVAGSTASAVSDEGGRFVLRGLPVGASTLEVRHPELGDHALAVSVSRPGERFEVVVRLSPEGMSIEIQDAAPAPAEGRPGGVAPSSTAALPSVTVREDPALVPSSAPALRAGSLVPRERIAQLSGSSRNLADLIRRAVPTLTARSFEGSAGDPLCLEFRGAQTRSLSESNASGNCNHPQVYLDGVPLTDPVVVYSMTAYDAIQWVQAISPAQAGAQFGGAPYGVILVATSAGPRGTLPGAANPSLMTRSGRSTFDWGQDPSGHPFWRAAALSAIGAAAGFAAGREVWRRCVYVDAPTGGLERTCPRAEVAAMGAVAVALPAVGSALGAHFGGRTGASEGRLVPALLGAALAILPGYGFSLATVGAGADATNTAGMVFLAVGTPLFTALADRLYRHLR